MRRYRPHCRQSHPPGLQPLGLIGRLPNIAQATQNIARLLTNLATNRGEHRPRAMAQQQHDAEICFEGSDRVTHRRLRQLKLQSRCAKAALIGHSHQRH